MCPRNSSESRDIDRGWAWVVLMASCTSTAIIYGYYINTPGIYFVAFMKAFVQPRSVVSWIITALLISTHSAGPISSLMLSKYGARKTMITGALLASGPLMLSFTVANSIWHMIVAFTVSGIGVGFVMSSSIAVVAMYFKKYFNIATGLTCSGAGVGIMCMGSLQEWALKMYGWKGSLLFQSGILLQILVFAALVFPIPSPNRTNCELLQPNGVQSPVLQGRKFFGAPVSILMDHRFLLIAMSFTFYFGGLSIILMILKDAFLSHEFETPYETITMGFGIGNTVGRFAAGLLAQYFLVPPVHALTSAFLNGITPILLLLSRYQWHYLMATIMFGFLNGYQIVVQSLSISFMFGRDVMAILWGYGVFSGLIAVIGLVPLAGWLIDATESYFGSFLMAAFGFLLSGLLILVSYWLHKRHLRLKSVGNEECKNCLQEIN